MSQATIVTEERYILASAPETFWKEVHAPEAKSLWAVFTGKPLPDKFTKDEAVKELKNASIGWARIARWLSTQARPGETPESGVSPHHWEFDRAFYLLCRNSKIEVSKIMTMKAIGLGKLMKIGNKKATSSRTSTDPNPPPTPAAGSATKGGGSTPQSATGGAESLNGSKAPALLPGSQPHEPQSITSPRGESPEHESASSGCGTSGEVGAASQGADSNAGGPNGSSNAPPVPQPAAPPQLGEPPEHESASSVRGTSAEVVTNRATTQGADSNAGHSRLSNAPPVPQPAEPSARLGASRLRPEEGPPCESASGSNGDDARRRDTPSPPRTLSREGHRGEPGPHQPASAMSSGAPRVQTPSALDPPANLTSSSQAPAPAPLPPQATHAQDLGAQGRAQEKAPVPTHNPAPTGVTTDFLPLPQDNTDQAMYEDALLEVLAKCNFKEKDEEGQKLILDRLPPRDSPILKATPRVAIKGRDPRPTPTSQLGRDFVYTERVPVVYDPNTRVIYAWSHLLLDALAEDHRFNTGTFLVTASVGTGEDASLGVFGPEFTECSSSMRIPLMLGNPSSRFVQLQKVRLAVVVKMELEKPQDRCATEDKPPASSRASVEPSKGKQPALARTPATSSKGKGGQGQKQPRVSKERKLAFLVNYIRSAKDPKGRPWDDNDGVEAIRLITTKGTRVCISELIAAARVVSQLLRITVTADKAPSGTAGRTVPANAIAVFLKARDNWVGQCKKLNGLLEAYARHQALQEYLTSTSKEYLGLNTLLQNVIKITNGKSLRADEVRPKKRRRVDMPREDNEAGPSNVEDDYDGRRGEYIDPDDDEDSNVDKDDDDYSDEWQGFAS